jgi:FAD binding domain
MRKTLDGLRTDLDSRVLDATSEPVPGLYAAGEVAGFGGGGVHGYAALEGSFLGGSIFSGVSAKTRRPRSLLRGRWSLRAFSNTYFVIRGLVGASGAQSGNTRREYTPNPPKSSLVWTVSVTHACICTAPRSRPTNPPIATFSDLPH